jgi:hypothetical protein
MGLLDDLLNKAGDVINSGQDAAGQIGDDLQNNVGELGQQAQDAAESLDIPGTELDESIKEILGLDK